VAPLAARAQGHDEAALTPAAASPASQQQAKVRLTSIGPKAPSAGASDRDSAAGGPQLGEVVVTAQRRKENVQNVPMSITVLSSAQLELRDVKTFIDYAASVPNLGFGYTGFGFSGARTISIRGVAGNDTTGFYLDDTPLPESLNPQIVDIDRIEVLRGPQGTLYGARSEGGTVRLITAQPDDTLSTRTHVGLSDTWNTVEPNYVADGAVNLPLISDRLAVRIVGLYDREAGFFRRDFPTTPGGTDYQTVKNVADNVTSGGSIALRWQATDALTVTPRLLFQQTTYNGFPYSDHTAYQVPAPSPPPAYLNLDPSNFTQTRLFNIEEGGYDRWSLGSLTLAYHTGFGDFISSSSYLSRKLSEVEDMSDYIYQALGTQLRIPVTAFTTFYQFVQEVRFVSHFSGPVQLVSGVYFESTTGTPFYQPPIIVPGLNEAAGGTPQSPAPGTNPQNPDELGSNSIHTETTEPALYGELSYQVTAPLKLIAGARVYRNTTKSFDYQEGLVVGGPRLVDPLDTLTQSGVNPKVGVNYQLTPDKMIYALASKGWRPGGVSMAVPPAFGCGPELAALGLTEQQIRTYKSDSLWNYEVGEKTSWLDHTLTVDSAAYYIKWQNLQQFIVLPCGSFFTGNAGAAKSEGFELEIHARPLPTLELNGGIGYTHAIITAAGTTSPQQPGSPVYQVPDWTGNAGATYTHALTGDVQLVSNLSYSYVGESKSGNNNPYVPRTRAPYSLVDSRIAVMWQNYQLAFVGKNLTNEHANLADNGSLGAEVVGRPRIVVNQPRTLGLEFVANF
jgi:outer membrane receptor protein involved in Fe transport